MADSPWSVVNVNVQEPARGSGSQDNLQFAAQSCSLTWSWGSQPATAIITYVSQDSYPMIVPGAFLECSIFGKKFWGLCRTGPVADGESGAAPTERASAGKQLRLEFVDTREYLKWDMVFCAFNKTEVRIINGVRVRRYWHIYPQSFQSWTKSYTAGPLSASTIISAILGTWRYPQPWSVGTNWQTSFHHDQIAHPVFDVDALNGRRLDDILQEISDAQGLLFTIRGGPFNLVWARKGEGALPAAPSNSDDQRFGDALSGNPNRMIVVGDRNRYQVLDISLLPDWNAAWHEVFSFDLLADDLFRHETDPVSGAPYTSIPGDTEQIQGRHLAAARASEITVGQYADLRLARDGKDFYDFRKYAGRSRLEMPAALYLRTILFRAFRPPSAIPFYGRLVSTRDVDIVGDSVARVYHDPATGKMNWSLDNIQSGNGYAIAKGYKVGEALFQSIPPERFDLNVLRQSANLWQTVSFQLDESGDDGRYLLFDEPMIKSDNLVSIIDGHAVLNAQAQFQFPEIRAALTFEADRFIYTYGQDQTGEVLGPTNARHESIFVGGLRNEFIADAFNVAQVPYGDGHTANDKALVIALSLLGRPYRYANGSFRHKLQDGDPIPELTGMMNRITLEYSPNGHFCTVEYTNEPGYQNYQPERELDRRVRQQSLLPGQKELQEQAHTLRLLAKAFHQSPDIVSQVSEVLTGRIGSKPSSYPVALQSGSGTLAAGTPLWKAPTQLAAGGSTQTRPVMPSAVGSAHSQFAGATMRDQEDAAKPMRVQRDGETLIRVKGPIGVGDTLVRQEQQDYLVKQSEGATDAPAVGSSRGAIPDDAVRLIPVLTGGVGGAAESGPARWA